MKNRPSTRRSNFQNNFSPYLSRQRLRSVQSLLQPNTSKNSPDAIISILGVDSRYNEGCRELADYLLFGFFTVRQMELDEAGLEAEDIDDVVILIRHSSISVYCGFMIYSYLLPYISHWPNLQVFCRSQSSEDPDRDTDVEEEYKVHSFVSMMEGCSTVGVPYLSSSVTVQSKSSPRIEDTAAVEKWPLIQSYALEGIGCGTFFTIKHSVMNPRDLLLPLYYQCDPVVLEKTISKSYPLFSRHWGEAVTTINNSVQSNSLLQLQEDQILEPLQCYFKHGQLSKLRLGKKAAPEPATGNRRPFVVFGARSLDSTKNQKPATVKGSARKGHNSAFHMVMQCVAPRSPVTCTRTYFFKPGDSNENTMREFNDLVRLYTTCVEGCKLAINEFATSLTVEKAERKAIDHLLTVGGGSLVFDAKCKIVACDSVGREVKIVDGKQNPFMKTIRVAAENIKTSHKGDSIGSVVFSETFLDSSFLTVNDDDNDDVAEQLLDQQREATFTIITSDISNYMEWKTKKSIKEENDSSVELLAVCDNVTVCSNSPLYSPPCKVDFTFGQDGKMSVTMAKSEMVTVQHGIMFYDGEAPGKVGLLVVNFDIPENKLSWNSVSPHMRSELVLTSDPLLQKPSKCLVLALMPRSQAHKAFYAKDLHKSQTFGSQGLTITVLKSLPPDLFAFYQAVQNVFEKGITPKRDTFQNSLTLQNPVFSDFVKHYTVSSVVGDFPVPKSSIGVLLKNQSIPLKTNNNDEKVCVTILIGLPCSGPNELSLQLINLNKEKVRWVVIRPSTSPQGQADGGTVDKDNLQDQLAQAVSRKHVSRPSAATRKKLRIIVLAVGFFDLCDIVQCVISHRDGGVRKQMFIGAATTCIRPQSVFLDNRQTFPKFFEQCSLGIVSNIAFTTAAVEAADITDKNLAKVQSLVRNVNPQAASLICHHGKLSRQSDFELVLSETSFETLSMRRERQLLLPGLSLGKQMSGLSRPEVRELFIEFRQPLSKGTFCAKLRALKSSLATTQTIGRICFVLGYVVFTDTPSQEYDLSFASLVGEVELIPRPSHSQVPAPPPSENAVKTKQYNLKFYGINMNGEALKEWMRKCGRQKPSKKCHKTRSNLTKTELKEINEDNITEPPPEGYFFNGSFFVNLFNSDKKMEHPNLQKFIDEYIVETNREIDRYNANIDRQNIKDVFDE